MLDFIIELFALKVKFSHKKKKILQSCCISAAIKQGASEVKTSYWLFHTDSGQNRTSGVIQSGIFKGGFNFKCSAFLLFTVCGLFYIKTPQISNTSS